MYKSLYDIYTAIATGTESHIYKLLPILRNNANYLRFIDRVTIGMKDEIIDVYILWDREENTLSIVVGNIECTAKLNHKGEVESIHREFLLTLNPDRMLEAKKTLKNIYSLKLLNWYIEKNTHLMTATGKTINKELSKKYTVDEDNAITINRAINLRYITTHGTTLSGYIRMDILAYPEMNWRRTVKKIHIARGTPEPLIKLSSEEYPYTVIEEYLRNQYSSIIAGIGEIERCRV